MGIPCVTAAETDVAKLLRAAGEDPAQEVAIDIEAMTATHRGVVYPVTLPDGARTQLLRGTWDATRILVDALPQVREAAARLPYVGGCAR